MDNDDIPLSYLLSVSDAGLEAAELRYRRDMVELSKRIREVEREKDKELNALITERQRLSDCRSTIAWFRRNRKELLRASGDSGESKVA